MKNKKIIDSLNKILPSESSKKQIIDNILTKNTEKKSINYKLLIPILGCIVLILLPFIYPEVNENNEIKLSRNNTTEIIYKGICYEEVGIYNGSIDDLEFIEQSREFIMGDKIYKVDDSIVFQNSENYIEFIKCGGERK